MLERGQVDWKVIGRIVTAWVVTVPSAALLTMLIYGLADFLLDLGA